MKKIFVISIIVFAAIMSFLYGCAKKGPSSPDSPTATATITPTATDTTITTATTTVTATATATATNTHISVLYSDTALDGYVDQYSGYNNTSAYLEVGDANTNAAMQGAVSFALPSIGGSFTSAVLRVTLSDAVGSPLTDIAGGVNVSHITPNYTSGTTIPYLLWSSNSSAGVICNSTVSGTYELDVTAAVENDRVNGRANAQFRLYLNGLTDNDNSWDVMEFYSGDIGGALRPQLIISYSE